MAVHTIRNEGTDTSRTPSASIWGRCPWNAIFDGHVDGAIFFDDFLSFPKTPPTTEGNWGQYAMFSSTGGTAANLSATTLGGVLAIGSDDDNEGASLRTLSTPFQISKLLGPVWFECRVKSSTITDTKHGFFVGLMENAVLTATVPIAADGTLADQNFVGFHRLEGDGDAVDVVYKANTVTQVSLITDAATLVADTFIKLGFKFEPQGDKDGVGRLSFYVNGARQSTSYAVPDATGTDFPADVAMGPVFAVLNATGTTPGTSSIDWWRCAQQYTGF